MSTVETMYSYSTSIAEGLSGSVGAQIICPNTSRILFLSFPGQVECQSVSRCLTPDLTSVRKQKAKSMGRVHL